MSNFYNTQTIENEIKKQQYLIEHSQSKSQKLYHSIILIQLNETLSKLTTQNYLTSNLQKIINYDHINKNNINLSNNFLTQLITKNYTTMIKKLTSTTKKNFLKPSPFYFNIKPSFNLKDYLEFTRINNYVITELVQSGDFQYQTIQQLLSSKGIKKDLNYIYDSFNDIFSNYKYSYGVLLSHYYLELYQSDPELTKKHLQDFINCIGIADDYYMLNHFGINQEKFLNCNYLKTTVANNEKN